MDRIGCDGVHALVRSVRTILIDKKGSRWINKCVLVSSGYVLVCGSGVCVWKGFIDMVYHDRMRPSAQKVAHYCHLQVLKYPL